MYQDVSNSNGLIAFKINRVKIRRGYERIIHKIDLNDIKNNIIYIGNLANKTNLTTHLSSTLDHKLKLAHTKINNLLPRRTRRGLINALGAAIKFIAGNPDSEDLLLINQDFEKQRIIINKIISNEFKQIKINNLFEHQLNKVSETLRDIKESIQTTKNELNIVNLIFNVDMIIKMLEDLEEQIVLSKANLLNKNILSSREKEYIWSFLNQQKLRLTYEDEIFTHVSSIVAIKENYFIIIAKIPIVEDKDFELLRLEPIGRNGTRIDTEIKYVARNRNRIYKQSSQCTICEETSLVNDECIFNILNNLRAKCSFTKQSEHPQIKEITSGVILVNTVSGIQILDSCGDSRIITTPTIVETENCTIKIENNTFTSKYKMIEQIQFITPIFGKVIEAKPQKPDLEDLHTISISNLDELHKIKLHLYNTQTVGGSILTLIIAIAILLFCLHRYFSTRKAHKNILRQTTISNLDLEGTDIKAVKDIALSACFPQPSSTRDEAKFPIAEEKKEDTKKSRNPEPRFVLLKKHQWSSEDA